MCVILCVLFESKISLHSYSKFIAKICLYPLPRLFISPICKLIVNYIVISYFAVYIWTRIRKQGWTDRETDRLKHKRTQRQTDKWDLCHSWKTLLRIIVLMHKRRNEKIEISFIFVIDVCNTMKYLVRHVSFVVRLMILAIIKTSKLFCEEGV